MSKEKQATAREEIYEMFIAGLVVSVLVLIICTIVSIVSINKRIYPNGNKQELVTRCYLAENYSSDISEDGYIYLKGEKKSVKKLDARKTEVKVEYNAYFMGRYQKVTKWIPKKQFYPYYTLRELSEIANKTYKK